MGIGTGQVRSAAVVAVRLTRVALETAAGEVWKQDLIAVVADEERAAASALELVFSHRAVLNPVTHLRKVDAVVRWIQIAREMIETQLVLTPGTVRLAVAHITLRHGAAVLAEKPARRAATHGAGSIAGQLALDRTTGFIVTSRAVN